MVASRDIEPGETIIIEHPFAQGPLPGILPGALPACLQCGKLSSKDSYRCSRLDRILSVGLYYLIANNGRDNRILNTSLIIHGKKH